MFIFSFVQVSHCLHEILDQCGAFSKLLMCCESPMIPRELGQLEIIAKVSRKYISKKTSLISQKFGRENIFQRRGSDLKDAIKPHSYRSLYPPQRSCRGVYWFHHVRPSIRLQTNPMSYDNLSCVSQNLLKLYQLFTGEERRIPFIFDDFHFCRSRVIGLDMTENRIFTLCCMIA